jgi:hypothetical protein
MYGCRSLIQLKIGLPFNLSFPPSKHKPMFEY